MLLDTLSDEQSVTVQEYLTQRAAQQKAAPAGDEFSRELRCFLQAADALLEDALDAVLAAGKHEQFTNALTNVARIACVRLQAALPQMESRIEQLRGDEYRGLMARKLNLERLRAKTDLDGSVAIERLLGQVERHLSSMKEDADRLDSTAGRVREQERRIASMVEIWSDPSLVVTDDPEACRILREEFRRLMLDGK